MVGAGLFLLLLAMAWSPTIRSKNAMVEGREAFTRAQDLLMSGDEAEAKEQFVLARSAFLDARQAAGHPSLRALAAVPLFGRTPDSVRDLAEIGVNVADAGFAITDGLGDLPNGLASLSPDGNRIPIEEIEALQEPMEQAAESLDRAEEVASGLPESWVLGQVAQAGRELRDRVSEASDLASSASSLFSALPEFAGGSGPRRYFVAGQNPAEARGTGGFIGVYSVMTMDDGRMRLERFRGIEDLRRARSVEPPPEELAAVYGGDLTSSAKAANLVPDAPTAAGLIEGIWDDTGQRPIDGVIFVDPQALARLLEVTGPVRSAELDTTLDSGNAVAYLTNDAYFRFATRPGEERKDALGAATKEVWDRFTAGTPPREAIQALVDAVSGGHIVLHSAEPEVQAAFSEAGAAGEFRATGTDFLGSVINNAAGNKVDFYLQRELRYEVALGPDGTAEARATVHLANSAPAGAEPNEALGPYPIEGGPALEPGDDLSIIGTYCAPSCVLQGSTLDGNRPLPAAEHDENGLTLFSSTLLTRAQQERTLDYRFATDGVWVPSAVGGTYLLRLESQQAVKPVRATVVVTVPDGMEVGSASAGFTVDDERTATWKGEVGAGQDLWVSFRQPQPQRSVSQFLDLLGGPFSGL